MKKYNALVSTNLTYEHKKHLVEIVDRKKTTISKLVRKIIKEFLKNDAKMLKKREDIEKKLKEDIEEIENEE